MGFRFVSSLPALLRTVVGMLVFGKVTPEIQRMRLC